MLPESRKISNPQQITKNNFFFFLSPIPTSVTLNYTHWRSFLEQLRTLAHSPWPIVPSRPILQLAQSIAEFQRDSDFSKESRIEPHTQRALDYLLAVNDLVDPAPQTPPKRKTRTAQASSSRYYSNSWKVSIAPFEQAVSRFKEHFSDFKLLSADMDLFTQQTIADLSEKQAANYAKLDEKFESMRIIIEALMDLSLATSPKPKPSQYQLPSLGPNQVEQQPQMERWNHADLGYFDPYLDEKVHGPGDVVSVVKDVYYRNVVLFVQRIQNLVTFKGATLVRSNIPISLYGSALEWYTSKLDNQERESLNKDADIDNWISMLSQHFKVPTSVALDFLTSKSYSLDDAQRRRPPAQYVRAIIWYGIGCNLVDIANQLSFAY